MINLSFGVLHSKAKMAAFGLLFYSSAFGSYYSIDDPLTNVTVVFEYSPVLSILTSMDYCYCLCYNAHLCHCKSCNCF